MKDSGEEPNDESSNSQRGSKRHNRHSMEQIQILEAFFENCPLLNENQQNQLAREAELEPKQVSMWFQNKRTQIKCERVSKHISSVPERPSVTVSNLAPSKSNLVYPPSFGQEYNTNNNVQAHSVNTNNISIMSPSRQEHYELHDRQKNKNV